jgi:anti-sigma factor RsiW
MFCEHADDLMMRYLDGCLSTADAQRLHTHLSQCPNCRESFDAYRQITAGLSASPLAAPPEGFVEAVMERVRALPAPFRRPDGDTLLCLVWGAVSVLFGLGLLAFFNRDALVEFLAAREALAPYVALLPGVARAVNGVLAQGAALGESLAAAGQYISSFRYLLLAISGLLALAQYVAARRVRASHELDEQK